MQDLPLLDGKSIRKREIYTIRKGELVRDPIEDKLIITPNELIKIKERNKGKNACIFYDDSGKACTIYENRPSQCVTLKCWDTTAFMRVYEAPRPERKDIIQDMLLLGIIEEHEKRCNYSILENKVSRIETEGEKAVNEILEILRFDYQLRPFVSEKLDLDPEELNLFFGRPLTETIVMYGMQVVREPDGSFLLTKSPVK